MFVVWIAALPALHVGLATMIVVVLTLINVSRKIGAHGMKIAGAVFLLGTLAFFMVHFWWCMKFVVAAALAVIAIRYLWMTWLLLRNRPIKQAMWMLLYRIARVAATAALIWVLLTPVSLTLFGTCLLYWLFSNYRFREFRFRLF